MKKFLQNRYTLKFKNSEIESEFVAYHKKATYSHTRNAMILGLVMFYLFHFVDSKIVAGLKIHNDAQRTVIESIINENPLLHNEVTSMFVDSFEDILLQKKVFTSDVESTIWTIRYNTLILGLILLIMAMTNKLKPHIEYFASSVGVFGSIAVSLMISYVSGLASYIYLSGLILIIVWMAILARVRFTFVLVSVILIVGFNNLITSNEFFFDLLHHGRELVGGLVTKGQIVLNLPINNFFLLSSVVLALFGAYTIEKYARINFINNKENEELLLNILPKEIAELKKKDESKLIAQSVENVTILFADIVGFTKFSKDKTPDEVVNMFNELYSEFDDLSIKNNVEKIKTIGDGYMLASGVPTSNEQHAQNMANMALDMIRVLKQFNLRHKSYNLDIRIGINSGPAVAGVVGKRKFAYDIWGDTVNTASRMESGGVKGRIQISKYSYELLKKDFNTEYRGEFEFKGKGKLQTYFLIDKKS